jgi:hypothetical protein
LNVLNQVEDQVVPTWTCSAGDDDGRVKVFYAFAGTGRIVSWGGRVIDGFENARVGVESAEVIDIVGSRELVVTISDKFVKIGGLFRGEREGCVVEIVKGCEDVSKAEKWATRKDVALESSDWGEPTSSCSIRGKTRECV